MREQGVCMSADVLPGIAVVAAPILQADEILGTVGLVCQRVTLDPDDLTSRHTQRLRDTATEIAHQLGSTSWGG
nr:IclR family transcriptional regulator C-terminal domain-containing protein [Mycobacterium sp.]